MYTDIAQDQPTTNAVKQVVPQETIPDTGGPSNTDEEPGSFIFPLSRSPSPPTPELLARDRHKFTEADVKYFSTIGKAMLRKDPTISLHKILQRVAARVSHSLHRRY